MALNVIALISGGKDSLFSILHCIANGHKVVALANLHPSAPICENGAEGDAIVLDEDIDSFMYQTIGHGIIPLYAEALGIPLFRQSITGGAANTAREYAPIAHDAGAEMNDAQIDETESLVPLLMRIKEAIPNANAISTGAILSTYQRTRVESVALRLGLTPLSYLWEYLSLPPYTQTSLLQDMRAVGQESRIVKVASGGLDSSFLWCDVAAERTISRMERKMRMFGGGKGGALIGEGGEFETLAFDGPARLWRQRIEVEGMENVMGEGGCAFVRISKAKVVEKSSDDSSASELRTPALLDTEFEAVLQEIVTTDFEAESFMHELHEGGHEPTRSLWPRSLRPSSTIKIVPPNYLQISNLHYPSGSSTIQMKDIISQLRQQLVKLSLQPSDVIHSTLLLRHMSNFTPINPIYGSLFTSRPNPPSRVTISCGNLLPENADIMLSVVVDASRAGKREGLHVQSRSYWAPANIGPYSQAISVPLAVADKSSGSDNDEDGSDNAAGPEARLVHIAGQIPLVPASMEIVSAEQLPWSSTRNLKSRHHAEFLAQAILSLQHLWRVGRAMRVQSFTGGVAFLSSCAADEARRRATFACAAWDSIHSYLLAQTNKDEDEESDKDIDVWDIKHRIASLDTQSELEKDSRPPLPQLSNIRFDDTESFGAPPVFVVQVTALPRAANIEWSALGISSATDISYTCRPHKGSVEHKTIVHASSKFASHFSYIGLETADQLSTFAADWSEDVAEIVSRTATVYSRVPLPDELWRLFEPSLIPCHAIIGCDGKTFDVLMVLRSDVRL